jgi:hypothetical protein
LAITLPGRFLSLHQPSSALQLQDKTVQYWGTYLRYRDIHVYWPLAPLHSGTPRTLLHKVPARRASPGAPPSCDINLRENVDARSSTRNTSCPGLRWQLDSFRQGIPALNFSKGLSLQLTRHSRSRRSTATCPL